MGRHLAGVVHLSAQGDDAREEAEQQVRVEVALVGLVQDHGAVVAQ